MGPESRFVSCDTGTTDASHLPPRTCPRTASSSRMASSSNPQLTEVDPREVVGSPEWQYHEWVEMLHSRSDLLEMQVRRMAERVVERPETFRSGIVLPYLPEPTFDLAPNGTETQVLHYDLHVRLDHKLKPYPEAALLIAEKIIRHHIQRINAKAP